MLKGTALSLECEIPLKERRGSVTSLGGFPPDPAGILEEALTGAGLWQNIGSVLVLVARQCIHHCLYQQLWELLLPWGCTCCNVCSHWVFRS